MNRQKEYSDNGRYTEIRKVTEGSGGGGSATAIKVFKCSLFDPSTESAVEVFPTYVAGEGEEAYMIGTEEDMLLLGSTDGEVPEISGALSNAAWIVYGQTLFVVKDGYDDGVHGPLTIATAL